MLSFLNLFKTNRAVNNIGNIAVREYAARKGTRERKAKLKKKKKEEKKEVVVVKKIYGKESNLVHVKQRPFDDSHYPTPIDDVFFHRKFQRQEYSFRDVVSFHREVHHETVYNQPNAPLFLRIDIDLKLPNRVTKCQDPWKSMVEMQAPFLLEGTSQPTVLAFCQDNAEEIAETLKAGADHAGGLDLIKAVQTGEVKPSEYDYVVCHPLVLTELAVIRGLMKRQFPSMKAKTIGTDLGLVVQKLKNGIKIKVEHSDQEPDFGYIKSCVGHLNMPVEGLEGNFKAYLQDTVSRRTGGKPAEDFILQCHAFTPFSFEKLRIDWKNYITM